MSRLSRAAWATTVVGVVLTAVPATAAPTTGPNGPGDPPPEDTAPPQILVERSSVEVDGWHNGPVDVLLRVTDDHTGDLGVQRVSYTLSGATTASWSQTYDRQDEVLIPLQISAEGSTRIDITAVDVAQYESTQTHWVGVDTSDPWVQLDSPVDGAVVPVGADVPVTFTCGDATSAVTSCVGSHENGSRLDTSTPGPRTVSVEAEDTVGRTTTRQATVSVASAFGVLEAPRIVGAAVVGRELTAVLARTEPQATGWQYDWRLDGETASSGDGLRLTEEDRDKEVTLLLTATRDGYAPHTWELGAGAVRPDGGIDSEPVIVGTPAAGQRLEVRHGEITPLSTVTYQWLRNGTPIPGGQGSYYTVVDADAGAMISTRVTAVSASVGTRVWVTPPVGPVTGGTGSTATPITVAVAGSVAGTARLGQRLTAKAPTWSIPGVTTTHQWLRNGTPIAGATGSTYLARAEDVRARLSVRFTGSAPGRAAATSTSAATRQVGKAVPLLRARYARGRVTVTVRAPGTTATGKVAVKAGGRSYPGKVRNGRAVVRVGKLRRSARLVAAYAGSRLVQAARAPVRR